MLVSFIRKHQHQMKYEDLTAVLSDFWNARENAFDSAVRVPYCQQSAANIDLPSWQISKLLGFVPFPLTGCAQRKLTNFSVSQTK